MDAQARLALVCFLTCFGSAAGASAHPRGPNAPYVVSVQDESGRELPTFHHAGQAFVLGRFGERYDVRVENHTGRRVEAVVSVDGRDVVSGGMGDFVHERGYLIDAHDQVVIEGFRQSWEQVAAFRFTSPKDSYSARMGTPQNVGVIGVAVFPERQREAIAHPLTAPRASMPARRDAPAQDQSAPRAKAERASAAASGLSSVSGADSERKSAAPEPSAAAARPSTDNLGTVYGESVASAVHEAAFERADRTRPSEVIALRYDDHDGLLARGIAVDPPAVREQRPQCGPQAFPRSGRFAPPPPMWD
jgi:hypothetical protein